MAGILNYDVTMLQGSMTFRVSAMDVGIINIIYVDASWHART